MKPDIELVSIAQNESFKAFAHGYPYRTVRWHYHPEYEIHLVTDTRGKYFIGDFIGQFSPGNLVLIGPNVPHNWISDVPDGVTVPQRGIVVQFTADYMQRLLATMPELRALEPMLQKARFGVKFADETANAVLPVMVNICAAQGLHRASGFLQLLELLAADKSTVLLSSASFENDPDNPAYASVNSVLAYLQNNFTAKIRESDLARLCNQSASGFSRSFMKSTGMTFVQYLNKLRVHAACELLASSKLSVTDICFKAGFSSVSNFNRRFDAMKGMSPMEFRRSFAAGERPPQGDTDAPTNFTRKIRFAEITGSQIPN
ncbi:AraC family transcriptional regulator [Rhodanobacter sp. BL-MT-08]